MFTRRDLLRSAALFPATASLPSLAAISAANAQTVDLLKIFVPAAPGGGWDQTARTIEQVLRAIAAVKGVQITNVGGAGGAVGLPQFLNQWKGQGNALMVAGMVMVGAIIANKSPMRLAQATPIARLTGEFLALVVPAQSPERAVADRHHRAPHRRREALPVRDQRCVLEPDRGLVDRLEDEGPARRRRHRDGN